MFGTWPHSTSGICSCTGEKRGWTGVCCILDHSRANYSHQPLIICYLWVNTKASCRAHNLVYGGYLLMFDCTSDRRHPTTLWRDRLRNSWAKAADIRAPTCEACCEASFVTAALTFCAVCCRSRCDSLSRRRPWPLDTYDVNHDWATDLGNKKIESRVAMCYFVSLLLFHQSISNVPERRQLLPARFQWTTAADSVALALFPQHGLYNL